MSDFLAIALAFPAVVYTVLLAVVLLYWGFVVLGAAHIDLLGHADGGADGIGLDHVGADVGGMAHHAGAADGHGGGGDAGGGDGGDAGEGGSGTGALAGLMSALHLRSVPLTVSISLIVIFAWLLSVLAMEALVAFAGPIGWGAGIGVFLGAPLLALPLTSLAVRPIAPLFVPHVARGNQDLVGKVCIVRTGSVDATFGEATLEDGGAGVVVRVRVDGGAALRRGDEALIVAWDAEREAFTVASMDEVLVDREDDAGKNGKKKER